MIEWGRQDSDRGRKTFIRILFIIFTLGIVLIILFGNTLTSFALPKVRTEKLQNGSLPLSLEGSELEKRSSNDGVILSNEAIHEDRNGSYVYKIEEQSGASGIVYIARKVAIQAVMTTATETLIKVGHLSEDDVIIIESGESLQDGDRVRLQ
ncbi:hypothetical protein [Cohnella sp. WQ 127256]|uniref:hypothetical protein n=1 Tax=Cohnella sp. WQ 127256 TaxID=2938790 RepID=UPI0021196FC4|nr:hypothetical protein [Cohnella sp. WQ 127256]